jgi:beta-lactam-binding protein with PASTA domain
MSRPFTIKPAAETIELDRQRESEVVFTVSNASGRPINARGRISAADPAQKAWFKLQDEPERKLKVDETTQYKVKIAVPPNVAAGSYKLQFDVVEVDNEESFTEGSPVGFQVKPAPTPTPTKFPWWIVAVAAGVLLVGGGITLWLVTRDGSGKMEDLVGMEVEEARNWVKNEGLKLAEKPELKDPNKANRITGQDPKAGEPVTKEETIVTLTFEAPFHKVPDVKGKPAADATEKLQELGFVVAVTQQVKDPSKAGTVISQDPAPDKNEQEGTTINLVAEKGLIQMPEVTYKSEQEARKILEDLKLTNVKVMPPDLFPPTADSMVGKIGNQSLPPGTPVAADVAIQLTPIGAAVLVPTLRAGIKFDEAAKILEGAKLKAAPQSETMSDADRTAGRENVVKRTLPPAGQRALEGSSVAVVIYGGTHKIDPRLLEQIRLSPTLVPRKSGLPSKIRDQ